MTHSVAIIESRAVVIRLRQTYDPAQIDVEIDFTPEMEDEARQYLERLFGYVVGSHTLAQVQPYVDKIIAMKRDGMVRMLAENYKGGTTDATDNKQEEKT